MRIEKKGSGNLVSEADLESEKLITDIIHRQFPGDAIIAEEKHAVHQESDSLWIVDPLDGTNNFAHGIAQFAVSVAYYQNGQAVCGAVFNPARDELFVASRGGGAFRNGEPLHVCNDESLDQSLIATGFYYDRGEMMRRTLRTIEALFGRGIHGIRRFGAASLDLCSVSAGEYGGFFEYYLAPWDFAAGKLIVEEAGGTVTDCSGNPLGTKASGLLASNTKLHPSLLDVIRNVPETS
jgi:myo-inositol-1(or 4)-monophosphatase